MKEEEKRDPRGAQEVCVIHTQAPSGRNMLQSRLGKSEGSFVLTVGRCPYAPRHPNAPGLKETGLHKGQELSSDEVKVEGRRFSAMR